MPLITSSRINKAPYFLHTDFMALKYPFGAGTTPVVAPTTVSATTNAVVILAKDIPENGQ